MKRLLILPHFGGFNNYFHLWLNSCRYNKGIEWLIITDTKIHYAIPDNVKVIYRTFESLKEEFQSKFDFKLCLKEPYKLCDFKPFYGYLFSEFIKGYDFWGYCDCDLIFGKIDDFLDRDMFRQYDKLLRAGHLSFIRNTKSINEVFRKYNTYKTTLASPAIYGYDESVDGYHLGFAGELKENGYRFYRKDELAADIDFRHFPFRIVTSPEEPCIFSFENGRVFRIERKDRKLIKTEMMYLHLQKRKMRVPDEIDASCYLICPNRFLNYDEDILEKDSFWQEISKEQEGYFDRKKERIENKKRDILRFLYEPEKIDSLLYRIKGTRGSK